MQDKKISIIVPIYNSQKYLKHCLSSIAKQTYRNFEILLIDDGSTDNSANICKEFVDNDNRFKYFYKNNSGVSNTRNYGLDIASGYYICFVDSDDWIPKNALSKLYESIIEKDYDFCYGTIETIWPHINNYVKTRPGIYTQDNRNNFITELYDLHEGIYAKLYKKSIIDENNLRFKSEICNGEDSIYLHSYLSIINSIVAIDDVTYCYNKLEKSTLVSKYNDDLNKWRLIECGCRENAYKRWGQNSNEIKDACNKRKEHFINELIKYYLINEKDNYKEKINESINLFVTTINKSELKESTVKSIELAEKEKYEELKQIYTNKSLVSIIRKLLDPLIEIMRIIKIAIYTI